MPEQSPGFLLWRATLSWQRRIRSVLEPRQLTDVQFVLLASLGGWPTTTMSRLRRSGLPTKPAPTR